ncbi:HigA family addiction module antitoxin [Desulfonatronum lacustre]|uniref:HigA family addiction module antitoxin n=1 Tax=Desulfonatronum lacustre TaxID=66849 RepID=UPI00048B1F23|nr:HigA family addiction module antitoxin [Desulfonatronum lacustre]
MSEYFVNRPLHRAPVHPGEILREDVLEQLGISTHEAAERLGVSHQHLRQILDCSHPITAEMALRIGKFAGNGPGIWLRLQQNYDIWMAEQRLSDELSRIETASVPCYTA